MSTIVEGSKPEVIIQYALKHICISKYIDPFKERMYTCTQTSITIPYRLFTIMLEEIT